MKTSVRAESWPIREGFRIARGARKASEVVVVELEDGGRIGRGECVPYARYRESVDSVGREIEAAFRKPDLHAEVAAMPAGAARNALDCALWDLKAKQMGKPVWELAGLDGPPGAVRTMRTVSLDTAERMRAAAISLRNAPLIKVKVDGGADLERIAAVHDAAPGADLIVDANESWSVTQLDAWLPELPKLAVSVLEQPLRAGQDAALEGLESPVPICADEAFHDRCSFATVERRYDMVNIKLDKAGGLTEALRCLDLAQRGGLMIMVGCMVATSLAIEPALLLAPMADYVDLDGPFFLERDRLGALHDARAHLLHPSASLWGGA